MPAAPSPKSIDADDTSPGRPLGTAWNRPTVRQTIAVAGGPTVSTGFALEIIDRPQFRYTDQPFPVHRPPGQFLGEHVAVRVTQCETPVADA